MNSTLQHNLSYKIPQINLSRLKRLFYPRLIMKIFHSAKTQAWIETVVTAIFVVSITYWTILNDNSQAKFLVSVVTVMGVGLQIKRITDLSSQEEISKLNTQIKSLEVEIKDIKSDNNIANEIVTHLVKHSEEMNKLVNQLGEHPVINKAIIYKEIKEKINNYNLGNKEFIEDIRSQQEVKIWFKQESVRKILAREASNSINDTSLKSLTTVKLLNKQLRSILYQDIYKCLDLLNMTFQQGISVNRIEIHNSQLMSYPQDYELYVNAIEHIKEAIDKKVYTQSLSTKATQFIKNSLDLLINKISS